MGCCAAMCSAEDEVLQSKSFSGPVYPSVEEPSGLAPRRHSDIEASRGHSTGSVEAPEVAACSERLSQLEEQRVRIDERLSEIIGDLSSRSRSPSLKPEAMFSPVTDAKHRTAETERYIKELSQSPERFGFEVRSLSLLSPTSGKSKRMSELCLV